MDEIPQDEIAGDRLANYTIKNLPLRARLRAAQAARRASMPLGEWMARAIEIAAERQERNAVLPPAGGDSRAVATIEPPDPLIRDAVALSLPGVRDTRAVTLARRLICLRLEAAMRLTLPARQSSPRRGGRAR